MLMSAAMRPIVPGHYGFVKSHVTTWMISHAVVRLVRVREGTERPSPLAAIESRVQDRAKDLALDVGDPAGAARLRALIDDEVERWRADHRRGLHEVDVLDADGVADRAYRNLA